MKTYKKDPYANRLSYWKLTISYPEVGGEKWRANNLLGIVAHDVGEAIAEAGKLHPSCTVWSISHQGTVDNAEGGS